MDHEKRISSLEKELAELKQAVQAAGLTKDFIDLPLAAKMLEQTPRIMRYRIKNDDTLIIGKHYTLKGRHYKINIKEWRKLIESDARAKLA